MAWAAIGCAILGLLALTLVVSCGWMASRLFRDGADDETAPVSTPRSGDESIGTMQTVDSSETSAVPTWIPPYPGSQPEIINVSHGDGGESGAFTFQTTDAVEQVLDHYQTSLENDGFLVQRSMLSASGSEGGLVGGSRETAGQGLSVMVSREADHTRVVVNHSHRPG